VDDCLFCKINKGEIPAEKVYEDDQVFAIKDIHPQAPTHLLIMPKKHFPTIMDIEEQDVGLIGSIYLVVNKLAEQMNLKSSGFRVVLNCGSGAGQSVFHIHFHLLSGRPLNWPPG
jgi:histidine triad (HIT) family protein